MRRLARTDPPRAKARPRVRNAAATRAAILASAREAFARAGYDGAGMREIAAGAGVTAMLVNRYFGSKEELFAEVVTDIMARPIILTESTLASKDLGRDLANALVAITAAGGQPLDGFRIMLRSAGSTRAAEISRSRLEAGYHQRLAAALPGEHAAERAAVALALVAGVQVMRQMVGLRALAGCPPGRLAQVLTPVFRALVDGPRPRRRARAGRTGGTATAGTGSPAPRRR